MSNIFQAKARKQVLTSSTAGSSLLTNQILYPIYIVVLCISSLVAAMSKNSRRCAMSDSFFPPEIPKVGDLVRITPVVIDYVPRLYKMFCEESYVLSRFVATYYEGKKFVEVALGGEEIKKLRFNSEFSTWSIQFDNRKIQVEVEKILE